MKCSLYKLRLLWSTSTQPWILLPEHIGVEAEVHQLYSLSVSLSLFLCLLSPFLSLSLSLSRYLKVLCFVNRWRLKCLLLQPWEQSRNLRVKTGPLTLSLTLSLVSVSASLSEQLSMVGWLVDRFDEQVQLNSFGAPAHHERPKTFCCLVR